MSKLEGSVTKVGSKIERIELFHVDVSLPTPFFPAWVPGYPQARQRATLLRVSTYDGLVGHATGAAFEREREGLGDFIGPFLLGLDACDVAGAAERLRQASFLGWNNSWMEVAFWDIAAKARGVPMWRLIAEHSGRASTREPTSLDAYASFGEIRSAQVRAEALERAMRMGFTAAKIPMGARDELEDRARVELAREVVGPNFGLMAHAYQNFTVSLVEELPRWDRARAMRAAQHLASLGFTWAQDPLRLDAFTGLSGLAAECALPIAGGDIACADLLPTLLARKDYGVLAPDVTFAGVMTAAKLMGPLVDAKILFSPRTYGDGLSLTANLHALAAYSSLEGALRAPLELPWEPPAIIPEHRDALLSEPVVLSADGTVAVPTAPGLGVEIDPRALRRYAQRFFTLTPVRFVVSSARRAGLKQTAAFARKEQGLTEAG